MITMLCIRIYDIQSPNSELNFNEICVNESETYGFHPPSLPLLFKKKKKTQDLSIYVSLDMKGLKQNK